MLAQSKDQHIWLHYVQNIHKQKNGLILFKCPLIMILLLSLDTSLTVRSTIWCYTIGTGLGTMAMFGISQSAVQRFCSMPTLKAAQK